MVAVPVPSALPAVVSTILAAIVTGFRFTGHFLLALVSVIFLGSGTEH